jgi:DNA polymerase III delta prime subunit
MREYTGNSTKAIKKLRSRGAINAFVTYTVAIKTMRSIADAKRLNLFDAGIQAIIAFP